MLDLDGTLLDSFEPIVYALNQTLMRFGHPQMTPLEVRRYTGRDDGTIASLFGDQWEEAHAHYLMLHDRHYLEQTKIMPGAIELLQWLHEERVPIAIVTNKGQHRAEVQIAYLGWDTLVGHIVGYRDGHPGKPHPDPVLAACRHLHVRPEYSLFIGDGIADMQAATAASVPAIGLTHSYSDDELSEVGATYCFSDLMEVHRWLKRPIH
ncbi:MAG TPA: HAD family hydrolase [Mariprofundaceae bacterium]|nr:HAD family hydrolase [Mariprofundaceae bacterium]